MTMKIPARIVLLMMILFLAAEAGHSTMRVVQKEVSVSREQAGHVLVQGTDEPANGVTVELRSRDWKTVLASTKTDEKGYFSLEKPMSGRLFNIRVSAPGTDICDLRVRISKNAAVQLTVHLSVAT